MKKVIVNKAHRVSLLAFDNPKQVIAEFRFGGNAVNIMVPAATPKRRVLRVAAMSLQEFKDLFKGVLD